MIISVLMLATDSARNVGFLTQYITVMTNYITMHYPGRTWSTCKYLSSLVLPPQMKGKAGGNLAYFGM